jgi:hypothetical protein
MMQALGSCALLLPMCDLKCQHLLHSCYFRKLYLSSRSAVCTCNVAER